MKRIYFIMVGALISTMLLSQCTDPLKGFELNVSTDIIHYTTLLQVEDGNGNLVSDLNVAITGGDAEAIYNLAGNKEFKLNSGLLGLGVHPEQEPTSNNPVQFSVVLSGTGYITQIVPVIITSDQFESVITVDVLKTDNAPQGVVVNQQSVALANNATTSNQVIKTTASAQTQQTIEINIPSETQFQDEAGTVITGNSLRSIVVYADPAQQTALNVFPGGSLTATNVIAEGSSQIEAGSFMPAGMVSIEFFLGNTQVRKFSKPITLTMEIDPDFENTTTGGKIKAGDQLGVYSYQLSTGQWKFEKNITVQFVNGKPVANFETDHLTWYMAGNYQKSFAGATSIKLNASWMQAGNTYPLTIQAILGGKIVSSRQVSVSIANNIVRMRNLPLGGGKLSIRVINADGQVLTTPERFLSTDGSITQTVTLNKPTVSLPKVTLQLYVRCPGKELVLNVLPTFYLYYKETNATKYKLLGVVKNGLISTTALTAGTEYDFKAIWGENIKVVNNKVVTVDNSGTVGTNPGDIIGEIDGANNLNMLTEACNTTQP